MSASKLEQARDALRILAADRAGWWSGNPTTLPPGVTIKDLRNAAQRMVKAGQLYDVKISTRRVLYFTRLADADAVRARLAPPAVEGVKVPSKRVHLGEGEGVKTDETKVTTVERSRGRYEVDPNEKIVGGFSTMRPGQYMDASGFSRYLDARKGGAA